MALSSLALSSPRQRNLRWVSNGILLLIAVLFLLPICWIVLGAFDARATLSVKIPDPFTVSNFSKILNADTTFIPLANSAILSGGCALVTVVCAVLAAYPLSRYQSRANKPFLYGVLFGTCLPITAMMVPVYSLFVSLNLLNSYPGIIFFMAATSLPMAIWMAKNFMDSVPLSLEEAAWVDGASMLKTLTRIVVPLMRPGLGVIFIFVFIQCWGNFFVPYILITDQTAMPASVTIYNFFGAYGSVAYGQLAAFSLLYSLPVLGLYALVQRLSGGSFSLAGAVKG